MYCVCKTDGNKIQIYVTQNRAQLVDDFSFSVLHQSFFFCQNKQYVEFLIQA